MGDIDKTDEWPSENPAGIARMKQSKAAFRRGETAHPELSKSPSPSVGVTFSNPTPPSMPSVGPKPPAQLEPIRVPEDEPPREPAPTSDESNEAVTAPGEEGEWSGWTMKVDIEATPPPTLALSAEATPPPPLALSAEPSRPPPLVLSTEPSPSAESAAPATAWSIPSLDFEGAKREGTAEPLFKLARPEGEDANDPSEIEGHRVHSRSVAQEDAEGAAGEGPPPKPQPRNYSQFVAVAIVLAILNVPMILVIHNYWTAATDEAAPVVEGDTRLVTPEDLAVITDEMWARPGQAETVLDEWQLTREEYSRLMAGVNTDPEMTLRYESARRTGPRGERKADLSFRALPSPDPAPSDASPSEPTPSTP